jgi:hypothetical protein
MARKSTEKNSKPAAVKTEAPQEVIDRIVTDILGGKGLTAVAKALTEEGVPTLGSSTKWHPPVVRGIFMKATGATGVKAIRDKSPVASKAAKDQPAKPAVKLENGTKGKGDEVKPDPKPTKPATRKRAPRKSTAKA